MKTLITVADDFGLTHGVNQAVATACRDGILTSASLMVAGPAAAHAVEIARALPRLRVGLHLVVIEGFSVLQQVAIRDLVDAHGQFPSDQLSLGVAYAFSPRHRRQLQAEIRAQFEAFAATGLKLDHANAHKHMHLHPVVGRLMIEIGREFGLRAIRVPHEPAWRGGPRAGLGDRALRAWCGVLRRQARAAGLMVNDQVAGLGWTGHMTLARVQHLIDTLPDGVTELYTHPATDRDDTLRQLMPDYEHEAEFDALLRARVSPDVRLASYSDLV